MTGEKIGRRAKPVVCPTCHRPMETKIARKRVVSFIEKTLDHEASTLASDLEIPKRQLFENALREYLKRERRKGRRTSPETAPLVENYTEKLHKIR